MDTMRHRLDAAWVRTLRLRIAPMFPEDVDAEDPRDAREGGQNGRAFGEPGQDLKDGHFRFVHDLR